MRDFLARSTNFVNKAKLKVPELYRLTVLFSTSLLLKKILSSIWWLFIIYCQRLVHKGAFDRNAPDEGHRQKVEVLEKQLEQVLKDKYFLLHSRLLQDASNHIVLDFLPFLMGKAVLMI